MKISQQKLLNIFSGANYATDYALAKAYRTCIVCGGPANKFRNLSTELEYSISALCQRCQDECSWGDQASG